MTLGRRVQVDSLGILFSAMRRNYSRSRHGMAWHGTDVDIGNMIEVG